MSFDPEDEPDLPAAPEPEYIGHYRVVQELGVGGMGVVYLALDGNGRAVAVKKLGRERIRDEEARSRLAREVETMQRIDHPRVAAVVDAVLDGPQPYIVTEYIPGVALDSAVEEEGALSRSELLQLAGGLAEAVVAIHQAGIVHRDLKPSNVILAESGPVVIDFGIAHVGDESRLTVAGQVVGTPGYVSPELVDGADITEAADWWGWAVTVAYAAVGHSPFGTGSFQAIVERVLAGTVDLRGVDPDLSPLIAAALAPNPAARLSADEVLRGLERYASGEPALDVLPAAVAAALPDAGTSPVALPGPPRRRRPGELTRSFQVTARPGAPLRPWVWDGDPRVGLPRCSAFLVVLGSLMIFGAAVAPVLVLGVFVLWMIVARTVDATMTFIVRRRTGVGPRPSDAAVAWAIGPWHVASALVSSMVTLALPLALGAGVVALLALVVAARWDMLGGQLWAFPLAGGMATVLAATWWGLGGEAFRRGSRSIVRQAARENVTRFTVWVLAVTAAVAVLGLAIGAGGTVALWFPLAGPGLLPR